MQRGLGKFRSWVVVALTVVGLTACTPAESAVDTTAPTPTVSEAPTSTAPVTTTTTVPLTTTTTVAVAATEVTSDIPFPDTTGEDWFRIATELESFVGWLGENPGPELVSEIAIPGSPFAENVGQYVANGWRELPGGRDRVLVAELAAGDPSSGEVLVRVASDYDGATTVDRDDVVVQSDSDTEPEVTTWALSGSADEGWRVSSVTYVGPYQGDAS